MPYATADDVINRYKPIQTMIGTNTLDVTTMDIASVYIADGESMVNAYLSTRYVTPLVNEPLLTSITSDIAIYRLLSDKAPRIPDFMQKRYENAMALLISIKSGDMVLNASTATMVTTGGDQFAWSNVTEPGYGGPVFTNAEQYPHRDYFGGYTNTDSRFG